MEKIDIKTPIIEQHYGDVIELVAEKVNEIIECLEKKKIIKREIPCLKGIIDCNCHKCFIEMAELIYPSTKKHLK